MRYLRAIKCRYGDYRCVIAGKWICPTIILSASVSAVQNVRSVVKICRVDKLSSVVSRCISEAASAIGRNEIIIVSRGSDLANGIILVYMAKATIVITGGDVGCVVQSCAGELSRAVVLRACKEIVWISRVKGASIELCNVIGFVARSKCDAAVGAPVNAAIGCCKHVVEKITCTKAFPGHPLAHCDICVQLDPLLLVLKISTPPMKAFAWSMKTGCTATMRSYQPCPRVKSTLLVVPLSHHDGNESSYQKGIVGGKGGG
jgi:hypothetical protein